MSEYVRKPIIVDAVTFDEFVQYGIEYAENLVDGEPWSFNYKGFPITRETGIRYLVPSKKTKLGFVNLPRTICSLLRTES